MQAARRMNAESVLVVDVPAARPRIVRVFSGSDVELTTCVEDALSALRARTFDLIIVGMDAAESRALRVIDLLKRVAHFAPLICVRASPTRLHVPSAAIHAVRHASMCSGASLFIDFFEFEDSRRGDDAIRTLMRDRVFCH